jgi:hypothetical protein
VQFGTFNLENATFTVIENVSLTVEDLAGMDGVFGFLGDELLVSFQYENRNYIFYNSKLTELSPATEVDYLRIDPDHCQISWSDNGGVILEIKYSQKDFDNIDRIGWTDSEVDYNYGMYLYEHTF